MDETFEELMAKSKSRTITPEEEDKLWEYIQKNQRKSGNSISTMSSIETDFSELNSSPLDITTNSSPSVIDKSGNSVPPLSAKQYGLPSLDKSAPTSTLNEIYGLEPLSSGNPITEKEVLDKPNDFTTGDIIGSGGQALGDLAPTIISMINSMVDKPRRNTFATYGDEAMGMLEGEKSMLASSLELGNNQIALNERTMMKNIDETSRGTNTTFAKKLATHTSGLEQRRRRYSDYLSKMMGITNKQVEISKRGDFLYGMQERQNDELGREDLDNSFTQIGTNLTNMGNSMESYGKQINDKELSSVQLDAINAADPYGTWEYDENGDIIRVNKH